MLTSITPLGERARNNRWWLTAAAHVVGATFGGVTVGAALGFLGTPLPTLLGRWGLLMVMLIALVAAWAMDHGSIPIPGLRRQVNEDWMVTYRGWVYGAGFGFQLGTGFATIITSGVTWLVLLMALLGGSTAVGALIGGVFGLSRGLVILSARNVRSRSALMRFSARLIDLGPQLARAVHGSYVITAVVFTVAVVLWN